MSEQQSTALVPVNGNSIGYMNSAAQVQAAVRAEEVKIMFMAAQHIRRDNDDCKRQILDLCSDIDIAESALYSYFKGGTLIEGASVDLIEDIATIWGRIDDGWEIMETEVAGNGNPPRSKIHVWALDYQSLKKSHRFIWVNHTRGDKIISDDRDVYELLANAAQRRKRACIESLIPTPILKAAQKQVIETIINSGPDPMPVRIKKAAKFLEERFGITTAVLTKWSNCTLDQITPTQLVKIKAMTKSMVDGAPASTFFNMSLAPPDMQRRQKDNAAKGAGAKTESAEDKAAEPGKGKKPPKGKQAPVETAPGNQESIQVIEPPDNSAQSTADSEQIPDAVTDVDWSAEFGG